MASLQSNTSLILGPWNNSNPKQITKKPVIMTIPKSSSSSSENNTSNNNRDSKMAKIKYEGTWRRAKQLTEMIQKKIREAEQVCGENKGSDECKVAWDEVEEISEAKANLKLQLLHSGDPLESFCRQHPDTEECRVNDHY